MSPFSTPLHYPRIKQVESFDELVSTPFVDGINALCWPRTLAGDFAAVAAALVNGPGLEFGITPLSTENLDGISRSAPLNDAGRTAIAAMLLDVQRLQQLGLDPELNAVNGFLREANPGPVRTDVASFHVDSATAEADTWLCTYHGMPSEGLRNDEARLRVDVPQTRAELWKTFGEEEGHELVDEQCFRDWLAENCYDLHYAPIAGAQPFSFGVGNLWRIATKWPGCPVPPCIHRAPEVEAGDGVRLLLIS